MGFPVLVTPVLPAGEQNAPAVTAPDTAAVVVFTAVVVLVAVVVLAVVGALVVGAAVMAGAVDSTVGAAVGGNGRCRGGAYRR